MRFAQAGDGRGALVEDLMGRPVSLRPAELASVQSLTRYLADALELRGPLTVERFPGGKANLTYLVRSEDRELVIRRAPFGPLPARAHDMEREHRVMTALHPRLSFVPRTLLLCTDRAVLGTPFFAMERVQGFVLRGRWPNGLDPDPGLRRALAEELLSAMVELHSLEPQAVGLLDLGRPERFLERQVERWQERWHRTATRTIAGVDELFVWMRHQPKPPQRTAVIHNDFKFENVIFSQALPHELAAVLDWDMATVGDPLADLGTTLVYWAQPDDDPERHGGHLPFTADPGFPSREELIDDYARRTGADMSAIRLYEVYGLVKIAVICEQLLRRHLSGDTEDERLMVFARQVPALLDEARRRAGLRS